MKVLVQSPALQATVPICHVRIVCCIVLSMYILSTYFKKMCSACYDALDLSSNGIHCIEVWAREWLPGTPAAGRGEGQNRGVSLKCPLCSGKVKHLRTHTNWHSHPGMLPGSRSLNPEFARDATGAGQFRLKPGTTDHTNKNWTSKTVPATIAEYASDIQNRFFASEQHSRDGYVEHEALQYEVGQRRETHPSSQANLGNSPQAALDKTDELALADDLEITNQKILLEADKVRAKFVSYVDTTTEVILRFDFINSHDTRVSERFVQTKMRSTHKL